MLPNQNSIQPEQNICKVCHQPILPTYYFCPNCGADLHTKPLSTSVATQIGIYAFSIILPMIAFIFVTRWPGVKYFKSKDEKAKTIGKIAWIIMILSTIFTIWYLIYFTEQLIQSTVNGINADFGIS